jgi:15-cis-phytoene synthase
VMAIRRFQNRRPRLLAPSRILRPTVRQTGGGRSREELIADARSAMSRAPRSLAFAARLLDRPTRERAWLLHFWANRCGDIAAGREERGTLGEETAAEKRIKAIRVLTARALDGQPTADPAFDAFGLLAVEAGLGPDLTDDVIEGFALDATGWRPRSEADLLRYCYHFAGAPAVMMARMMGVPADDSEMLDRACDLGLAIALAAIARDAWSDDADDCCYLPVEWLAEMDIPPGEHMKPVFREQLVELVARVLDLARVYDAAGRWGAAALPLRQRWPLLAAANFYAAIGEQVRTRGAAAWDHRIGLPLHARLRLSGRALSEALRRPEEPAEWPKRTRGDILVAVRMAGPVAPIPMTPLPDEPIPYGEAE